MTEKSISLAAISQGKEVTLLSVDGGRQIKKRLAEMGLSEGMKFKVLKSDGRGPCIILVGDTRLVLGHGMAERIMVQ